MGKPGFPIPLRESQALPRAGVWGNLVPPFSRQGQPRRVPVIGRSLRLPHT